jgi:hypothetical protein
MKYVEDETEPATEEAEDAEAPIAGEAALLLNLLVGPSVSDSGLMAFDPFCIMPVVNPLPALVNPP